MSQPALSQAIIQDLLTQIPADHPFAGRRCRSLHAVGGGCIHHAYCVQTDDSPLFIKINTLDFASNFSAEVDGLNRLSPYCRVPNHAISGQFNQYAFLLMEWLDLVTESGNSQSNQALGEQIAHLHKHSVPASDPAFGLNRDNFIGAMPQRNCWEKSWPRFYARLRLKPQLDWAFDRGLSRATQEAGYRLIEKIDLFFTDYRPAPSLIHGDLWGGNHGFTRDEGAPVLFDPAVYYADREAEIAMTELFGGFSARARQAYETVWPLDAGYQQRRNLYNLYHILNHFNLFGGGYGQQADRMIRQLLSEVGA